MLNWLLQYLEREADSWHLFGFIVFGMGILNLLYFPSMLWLLNSAGISIPDTAEGTENIKVISINELLLNVWSVVYRFWKIAVWEEVTFRFFPLVIALTLVGISGRVFVVALFSSILFGVAHGTTQYAVYHILMQGVAGLYFCLIFFKCGGFQQHYAKALAICVATHFFWNIKKSLTVSFFFV